MCNLYNLNDYFQTETHIIASYIKDFNFQGEIQNQDLFYINVRHKWDATPLEIERKVLHKTIKKLQGWDNSGEDEARLPYLFMISSQTTVKDINKERENAKVIQFTKRQNGKWFFEPNRRCFMSEEACFVFPRLASRVPPYVYSQSLELVS